MVDRCRVMMSDAWRCDAPMPCPDHSPQPTAEGRLSGLVERVSRVQATIYEVSADGSRMPKAVAVDLWVEDGELRMREYDAVQGRGGEFYDYVLPTDVVEEMRDLVLST